MTPVDEYDERYVHALEPLQAILKEHLEGVLEGVERIDFISVRAKHPTSFAGKCRKRDGRGKLKYSDPIRQVTDQIGARVVVYYASDVGKVVRILKQYLRYVEDEEKSPASESEFGYFGRHLLFRLPADVLEDSLSGLYPDFFELQVKTLFQHAWSQAHHGIGYKNKHELTLDERRKMALSAAQAWGSDGIFNELASQECEDVSG
ncbi:MAG TPA: RelA/SpoT domain-containing protein [Sphingopyxis sp.]|nr:RelA/SpoT domain-containing protein [Sphingopyxis sp.]